MQAPIPVEKYVTCWSSRSIFLVWLFLSGCSARNRLPDRRLVEAYLPNVADNVSSPRPRRRTSIPNRLIF
jgi:hypothetical protein